MFNVNHSKWQFRGSIERHRVRWSKLMHQLSLPTDLAVCSAFSSSKYTGTHSGAVNSWWRYLKKHSNLTSATGKRIGLLSKDIYNVWCGVEKKYMHSQNVFHLTLSTFSSLLFSLSLQITNSDKCDIIYIFFLHLPCHTQEEKEKQK